MEILQKLDEIIKIDISISQQITLDVIFYFGQFFV